MKPPIESLVRAFHDQILTDDEVKQLNQLLQSDAEAREVFLQEANLIAALEDIASDDDGDSSANLQASELSLQKTRLPVAKAAGWIVAAVASTLLIGSFLSYPGDDDKAIATITGLSGPLQWTGNRGQVQSDLSIGMKLPGGTVDGLSPESWFALEFNDGSMITIAGHSMLAFSDAGQKVLHLKSGTLSADVTPQPDGRPMLIHTRSAILQVIGTSFEIDADLATTALNVTEGSVRVKRLSDGQHVDVPARHQVVAAADHHLKVNPVPQLTYAWRSRFEDGPRRTYGRWIPQDGSTPPMLGCIPHVTEDGRTIYTSSAQVTTADAARVMTSDVALMQVKGRLRRAADLYVGMSLRTLDGAFAGRFQVVVPAEELEKEDFNVSLPIKDFELDPSLAAMRSSLPSSPNDFIVESIWCHTLYQPVGLAIVSFELSQRTP